MEVAPYFQKVRDLPIELEKIQGVDVLAKGVFKQKTSNDVENVTSDKTHSHPFVGDVSIV